MGRSFAAADTSHYTIGRRYDVVYTKSPLKAFPFGIVKQCKFDGEVALSPLYGVFTPSNAYLGLMIEAFFESPNALKRGFPALYGLFSSFYRQDPAARLAS